MICLKVSDAWAGSNSTSLISKVNSGFNCMRCHVATLSRSSMYRPVLQNSTVLAINVKFSTQTLRLRDIHDIPAVKRSRSHGNVTLSRSISFSSIHHQSSFIRSSTESEPSPSLQYHPIHSDIMIPMILNHTLLYSTRLSLSIRYAPGFRTILEDNDFELRDSFMIGRP